MSPHFVVVTFKVLLSDRLGHTILICSHRWSGMAWPRLNLPLWLYIKYYYIKDGRSLLVRKVKSTLKWLRVQYHRHPLGWADLGFGTAAPFIYIFRSLQIYLWITCVSTVTLPWAQNVKNNVIPVFSTCLMHILTKLGTKVFSRWHRLVRLLPKTWSVNITTCTGLNWSPEWRVNWRSSNMAAVLGDTFNIALVSDSLIGGPAN